MNHNYSVQQWDGLQPQKFNGSRKHVAEIHELQRPIKMRRHYSKPVDGIFKNASEAILKPGRRVFPDLVVRETDPIPQPMTTKHIDFMPLPKFSKGQRVHLTEQLSGHFEDLTQGIKTYEEANRDSSRRFILEDSMQRKVRVPNLPTMRNQIGMLSPGDKPYVSPEFSKEWFRMPDGYIPGSNIQYRGARRYLSNHQDDND